MTQAECGCALLYHPAARRFVECFPFHRDFAFPAVGMVLALLPGTKAQWRVAVSAEQSAPAVKQIPVAVIMAREPVHDNPWIEERWKVAGVVAGEASASPTITRALLRYGPEGEQYLWKGLTLRLHSSETDSYYFNIVGQSPKLYVYCEYDDGGEPCPRSVTAEYIDALSHVEGGNTAFPVPMPPDVYRTIEQFVIEHYVPEEPQLRRKRDRIARTGEHWQDE
jgi:hypothetical protein